MGEFFRLLSDVVDSVFRGWLGRAALIAFSTALLLLGLWGLEQSHPSPEIVDAYDRWRWWNSIIPLTAISITLLLINPRTPKH